MLSSTFILFEIFNALELKYDRFMAFLWIYTYTRIQVEDFFPKIFLYEEKAVSLQCYLKDNLFY